MLDKGEGAAIFVPKGLREWRSLVFGTVGFGMATNAARVSERRCVGEGKKHCAVAPTRAAARPSVALSFSKFATLTKKNWRTRKDSNL